jgi:hypothetical protein
MIKTTSNTFELVVSKKKSTPMRANALGTSS